MLPRCRRELARARAVAVLGRDARFASDSVGRGDVWCSGRDALGETRALPPTEMVAKLGFLRFQVRYGTGGSRARLRPAEAAGGGHREGPKKVRSQRTGSSGARSSRRADFVVGDGGPTRDADHAPRVNTIPGMTPTSPASRGLRRWPGITMATAVRRTGALGDARAWGRALMTPFRPVTPRTWRLGGSIPDL